MADAASPPKARNRIWRRVFWGVVIGAAGAGGAWYFGLIPPPAPAEPVVVQVAPVVRQVQALGEVLPISNVVTIAAPTGQDTGRIASITVTEGDQVTAGQVLAVLDTEPLLKAQLDQAIANEAVRHAAVDVRVADLDATARQLEAQIGQQEAALDKSQLLLDRRATLTDSGFYEDTALQDMQLDVLAATYTLANLQVQLERGQITSADGVRLDEASARAELAAATAARVKSEADYAKSFIRAPIDGRILAVFGRVGQQIDNAGFGEMGDTSRMKIRAEVYETDITSVVLGQAVTATSRAFEQTLRGTVDRIGVRISGQSILSTDPAAIVDARVVEVWILLDEASSAYVADKSGLQVTVAFENMENGND
jgi:HlyD family secretion protein